MGWNWLRHAFEIPKPESLRITPDQDRIISQLCDTIRRQNVGSAATLFLESVRPLNYAGAQALNFLSPLLSQVIDPVAQAEFAKFLEHPGAIDELIRRIENTKAPDESPKPESPQP